MTEYDLTFTGSSFTASEPGYHGLLEAWLADTYLDRAYTTVNGGRNGHSTWSSLVRLSREVLANDPDVLILDHANDSNDTQDKSSLEALIRRTWAANPATRIILIESPAWTNLDFHDNAVVTTPINADQIATLNTLAAHYGIPVARYWEWCKDVVGAGTYDLDELTADGAHPTQDIGYPGMAELIKSYLPDGGAQAPAVMPARLYDNGDYENAPTIVNGNTGTETGTGWANAGDAGRESSTEGDTIAFTATCQSFGAYRADGGTNTVEIDIDGGGFSAKTLYYNGIAIAAGRGEHTITIRIPAGGSVRIDEFWAV